VGSSLAIIQTLVMETLLLIPKILILLLSFGCLERFVSGFGDRQFSLCVFIIFLFFHGWLHSIFHLTEWGVVGMRKLERMAFI
jgi:hypothetical protein